MKAKLALLSAALLAFAPALHSADKNVADYTIKLKVLEEHSDTDRYGVHGTGRGRINDGGQVNGVEFQYDCDAKIGVTFGQEVWNAKWKKSGETLTVISHGIGDSHLNTCDIKVAVRDFIYVTGKKGLTTMTQQQWAATHGKEGNQGPDDTNSPQP